MKRITLTLSFCVLSALLVGFTIFFQVQGQHHGKAPLAADSGDGKFSETVTFGGWMTNPPVDRFPNNANTQFPRTANHHVLVPEIAKIKAGGYVNFIIGGFHVVAIYGNGKRPSDIDTSILVPLPRPGPRIIDDGVDRIYRGLDPTLLPAMSAQDRVEAVHFANPGTYLVICAVLPHFQEGMYGYVRVLPSGAGDAGEQK